MAKTRSNLKFNRVYWESRLHELDCHATKEVLDLMEELYKETKQEVEKGDQNDRQTQ